ncbi:type IV pilus secretin PilQ family protein [uncultured Endozoicomonas sp.]|uniref:type IV pilus secretin PilQ n=1 Tax=uncultured Endozoicomonas sp. TaxID=432652 RepID=UPI0026048A8A|nr:type IV pilus secretin PilQ family protein [uncultured Endozoicomonas sp.]
MNMSPLQPASAFRGLFYALLVSLPISGWSVTLKNMDVNALPDEMVELKLTFDGVAPEANGYSIEKPPRISLDLPFTRSALPKYNEVGFSSAKSVTVLETGDRTRLVINLEEPTGYTTKVEGNTLSVYLGTENAAGSVQSDAGQMTTATTNVSAANDSEPQAEMPVQDQGITSIDFQRGEDGEGKVVIALSDAKIQMDMNEQAGRIRLEFPGDVIPERLRNRLDVVDFATPVMFIDAKVEDGNSSIVIEPKGQFEYLAYQTDNLLTVSVKAPERQEQGRRAGGLSYKGDKLSLNFQDIEVRAVLQLIADFTDLNLVASDTVGGNVTLRLQNVPWDQALDIVLKAKGLDKRLEGNVLTVAPAAEIAAREREQLENEKQISELAPVYTDLVQINYADAAEISEVIQGSGDAGLLTERGSVQVVDRTNSLLIKDTQAKLDELRALIEQLDIPIRQVMIEARIVTLSTTLREELGVKWSGRKENDNNVSDNGVDDLFTDLELGGSVANAITIGYTSTNGNILNLELSALLSDGGGEIISQPKVITADKKKATIKSGKEVPYEEKTSSGATSVAFKDAVLGLEVTPQITPDGRVIMDIKINNDDVPEETTTNVPIISTNEITTQVLVEDGETIVLGGVFKQNKRSSVTKVPVLGDIPYLGALFRSKSESNTKEELLVFITPRIISEDVTLR